MVELSTSILSVKKENALATFYNLELAKTDYFHIDVMDGEFVKNNTNQIMQEYCTQIKQISNLPLDVHLMVNDIKAYIDSFIPFEPNIITFHIEACKDEEEVLELIKYVKDNGIKVGISIKPNTELKEIYKYLNLVHLVLIMTVEPGEGGQKLIPETITKIEELKSYIDNNEIDIDIEVDGGVNNKNIEQLKDAGANVIVAGSYIINSNDYKESIEIIKK